MPRTDFHTNHVFQNALSDDLPADGYIVVRADNVPHYPGKIYQLYSTAQQRAEALCRETMKTFVVLSITGKCEYVQPKRGDVRWTR